MRNSLFLLIFLITACAPASAPTQKTTNNSLEPFLTATPSLTPTPNVLIIAETPIPTSTPFVYTIKKGDTFSELAEQFKISQNELRAANPDVSPNSMAIGTKLLIPSTSSTIANAATLTPVSVSVTQTVCHPSADHGLWCFALIHNDTTNILEDVSAQITLLNENNNAIASQTAFLPLDIIPPNSSLPAYVFFPNAAVSANIQVQVLSAIQLDNKNSHYLPATLNNNVAQINWNGLTAQLSGQIILPAESTAATQVDVAAVAYDKNGRVVGVKRWDGGAIQPGGSTPFNFLVSSLGPAIDTVDFVVQAK